MSNSEQGRQSTGDSAEHGVESVNYNTVEVGTSSYLQLENSNEEVENVYVNVDAEDFDQEAQWGKVKELPPLPPKKRTNLTCWLSPWQHTTQRGFGEKNEKKKSGMNVLRKTVMIRHNVSKIVGKFHGCRLSPLESRTNMYTSELSPEFLKT